MGISSQKHFNRNQMMNLVFIFLSIFTFTLTNCYWSNNYDGRLSFLCPVRDGKYGAIRRMESHHSNHHEDRKWHFECSYDVQKAGKCHWTDWVNGWDAQLRYICPNNGYIVGLHSYHDNHREDRRWKIACCEVSAGLEDCRWRTLNGWDSYMNYNVDKGRVINGLFSWHDNHREDRIWKALDCRMKNCEVTHIQVLGKPQAYFKGSKVIGVKTGLNCGSQPKPVNMEHTVSYQRDITVSKMNSFNFGFASEVEVTAGAEGIGSVKSKVGYSVSQGYSVSKTETVSDAASTSTSNGATAPPYAAVLVAALAKQYEYIGRRVRARYTIKCGGVPETKYDYVNILSHNFLDVTAATLAEVKVDQTKCGAAQLNCLASIDTSSIITSGSAIVAKFKACFSKRGRAFNTTTEDTLEEERFEHQDFTSVLERDLEGKQTLEMKDFPIETLDRMENDGVDDEMKDKDEEMNDEDEEMNDENEEMNDEEGEMENEDQMNDENQMENDHEYSL